MGFPGLNRCIYILVRAFGSLNRSRHRKTKWRAS